MRIKDFHDYPDCRHPHETSPEVLRTRAAGLGLRAIGLVVPDITVRILAAVELVEGEERLQPEAHLELHLGCHQDPEKCADRRVTMRTASIPSEHPAPHRA